MCRATPARDRSHRRGSGKPGWLQPGATIPRPASHQTAFVEQQHRRALSLLRGAKNAIAKARLNCTARQLAVALCILQYRPHHHLAPHLDPCRQLHESGSSDQNPRSQRGAGDPSTPHRWQWGTADQPLPNPTMESEPCRRRTTLASRRHGKQRIAHARIGAKPPLVASIRRSTRSHTPTYPHYGHADRRDRAALATVRF